MIDKLLKRKPAKKEIKRPIPKKTELKVVPAKQYNELIDYYTTEMEKLRAELKRLNEQNTLIMKTAMKQGEKLDELKENRKST